MRQDASDSDDGAEDGDLARIMAALERVYHDDREKIRAFWEAAHPMLGGRSPSAVAGADAAGAERVLDLIAGFEAGFPV